MWNFVNKALAGMVLAVSSCLPATADVWHPTDLDRHVTQTNFVVGEHCTATLISVKYRLLLTNNHCIDQYVSSQKKEVVDEDGKISEIKIVRKSSVPVSQNEYDGFTLLGSRTWETDIVDRKRSEDLALLQIKATNIPNKEQAAIFTGDRIYRGEIVYAVGNALGVLDGSVTKGIVSSVNRNLKSRSLGAEFYYQIDAGIIGGNSGGALYNDYGELIGIPTAVIPKTHLGFAIPYTKIQEFLIDNCYEQLFNHEAETYEQCKGIADEEEEFEPAE